MRNHPLIAANPCDLRPLYRLGVEPLTSPQCDVDKADQNGYLDEGADNAGEGLP